MQLENKKQKKNEEIGMAYSIVEGSVKDFIDNAANIKLPRFQRKQTWNKEQNFKLCISVFKEYPVGVVIVNHNKDADWLLDGRQRRNALKLMHENYIEVYNWAKAFVKFSPNDSEEEVKDKFWKKIDIYLQKEFEKKVEVIEGEDEEDEEVLDSFDAESQYASLVTLLDIVLMVHGKKIKGRTRFESMFMFDGILDPEELSYTMIQDGKYVCDPVKLKKKILESIYEGNVDKNTFYYNLLRYKLDKKTQEELVQYMEHHWSYYENCIDVIKRSEAVIARARIGMIKLYNASVLDAQNIFSLVNDGGTKLTAEELLSARPFWNVKVQNPSGEVKDEVRKMYQKLGIDIPEDVYRWDFGATLLSRIDKKHLVFDELPLEKDSSFGKRMSLGFKLLSSIYLGGITNNDVTSLENPKKVVINWDVDIDKLVYDLNTVVGIIEDSDYFRYLRQWNKSIMNMTTHAAAQEFITIMYKRWIELDKPMKGNSGNGVKLCKEAMILFDRLAYEYCIRLWKGSSDSRLARDLKSIPDRLKPVSELEWRELLNELGDGTYKGAEVKIDAVQPLIYHFCAIKKFMPIANDLNTIYEIDHIVAQNIFNNSKALVNMNLKNSIANLSPLPKGQNVAKNDKPLNQIQDAWLLKEIETYAELTDEDIVEFSDITNIDKLQKKRMALYLDAFGKMRNSLLAN